MVPHCMTDREWKKGSAELLILSLLEHEARHGYDLNKLIAWESGKPEHETPQQRPA